MAKDGEAPADDAPSAPPAASPTVATPVVDPSPRSAPPVSAAGPRETSATGAIAPAAVLCPDGPLPDPERRRDCVDLAPPGFGPRQGESGEDWGETVRALRQDKQDGFLGDANAVRFGPEVAKKIARDRALRDLRNDSQDQTDLSEQGIAVGLVNSPGLDFELRKAISGKGPFQPSWTYRDDTILTDGDLEDLRRDLENADRARRGEAPE